MTNLRINVNRQKNKSLCSKTIDIIIHVKFLIKRLIKKLFLSPRHCLKEIHSENLFIIISFIESSFFVVKNYELIC